MNASVGGWARDAEKVLERLRRSLASSSASLPYPVDVATALRKIHEDPFDPDLTVGSLRRACGLRNNSFPWRFGYHIGLTPKAYIVRLRIEAAKRLLRIEGMPVSWVSVFVGYEHPESFRRAFRRAVGISPSQYRARAGARS